MIAIIGAMEEEVSSLISEMKQKTCHKWNGYHFYEGNLCEKKAIIARCGVGKVLSAMITQRIIDMWRIDSILFTGIAGSLNPEYGIGDIVIAKDSVQHDMYAGSLGFARGEIPYTSYRAISCDLERAALLHKIASDMGKAHMGRVLTGDVFIDRKDDPAYGYMRGEMGGDAVEMEGASVGIVSAVNGIPYNLVRIVSDKADGHAPSDFRDFLHRASELSFRLVERYLAECR